MVLEQMRSGPESVGWALPETEVGGVIVTVEVAELDLDPDDARVTWCPVCRTRTTMRAAITPAGRRFDACDGCGLLWHVDRSTGRAEASRWMYG